MPLKKPSARTQSGPLSPPAQTEKRTLTLLPVSLVLLSIISVQLGAALAKNLFPALGPVGTSGLRVSWAALILLVIWRKQLRNLRAYDWKAYRQVILFGITVAVMNLAFYLALDQIPLGITVTLEFMGPLAVAMAQSRKALDILWVIFAGAGVLLLAPIQMLGATNLPLAGVGLALLAAAGWAAYILLSSRVGRTFPGWTGLTLSTTTAAVLLLPLGIIQARGALLNPWLLAAGAGVGLVSTAIPFSLEMEALRRLPSRVFSILLSLEPAIAALIGFLVLHEVLTWRAILAIALVTIASGGAVSTQREKKAPINSQKASS